MSLTELRWKWAGSLLVLTALLGIARADDPPDGGLPPAEQQAEQPLAEPPPVDQAVDEGMQAENPPGLRGGALLPTIRPMVPQIVVPLSSEFLIDLPGALQLAETANPQIGIGREAIREALALHLEARALALPNLTAGANYHYHTGALQTSFGEIRRLSEQSLYFGGGSRTLAAETVAFPAVRIFTQLSDAIYAPLVAQQVVTERSSNSVAIENAMLMDVAAQFLELVAAEASLEAYRCSQAEMAEIERTTGAFARTGQGREGDYKRAQAEALLLRVEEQRAQERVAVASADLARLLHLDPAVRLTTVNAPIELVQLVEPTYDVEQLVQTGLMSRPEAAARSAAIGAADSRVRQECMRPFLPLISVGYSAGGFGGGSNRQDLDVQSFWQHTSGRTDFDVWAIWTMQNFGLGNIALQNRTRAERDMAIRERGLTLAEIRAEVTEAFGLTQALRQKVIVTRQQLQTAERGAWEELLRTRAGEGLPIEAISSMNMLSRARQDAIRALVGYNTAQFRLFVAIGQTPTSAVPTGPLPAAPEGVEVPAPE